MKIFATPIAAAVVLMLQGAFAGAQATNASGHCTAMTVTDYVSSDAQDHTNTTNWANITDGHLNFTTAANGCVAITFSGSAFLPTQASSHAFLYVRTLLDGNALCMPALTSTDFYSGPASSTVSANAFTHVCKNVAAGAHTVQVQFSTNSGAFVEFLGHTLTVTHN